MKLWKRDRPITARDADLTKEDEMLPEGAKQVKRPSREGNVADPAGKHGPMAPESARGLETDEERKE